MSQSSHWTQHAAQWARVGPPLRPVAQDVALFRRALALRADAAPVALLLGATSELVDLPWPAATRLFAADRSLPMLLAQRPQWRFAGQWLVALNADWRALPLAAASVDGIVGDGALTTLPDMTQVARVGAECARVLRPGGALAMRLFCAPAVAEGVDDVIADARAGRVGGFHAWKWRFVMAMHAGDAGATLGDIWCRFAAEFADRDALAQVTGWPREAIDTLDAYRGAGARYVFPPVAAVAAAFGDGFALADVAVPDYELGARCPVVRFVRR